MEWNNEKVLEFLQALQTEPCLWHPKHTCYKNRASQTDAWRRILEMLPFTTTIEEMKKKKESLLGYYRANLNKYKKSLKFGAGKNEVYSTNWFAFEPMDSFLRVVYDNNHTLDAVMKEESVARETIVEDNDEANKSPQRENSTQLNYKRKSQNVSFKSRTNRQVRNDLPPKITAGRRQTDEAFQFNRNSNDDEYETFGKLIAIKLKKIKSLNTREIVMNDIHNLVFRSCMEDRLSTYQSPPEPTTTKSPRHETSSPSPNPSTYTSPLGEYSLQSSQETFQELDPLRAPQIIITDSSIIKIIKDND